MSNRHTTPSFRQALHWKKNCKIGKLFQFSLDVCLSISYMHLFNFDYVFQIQSLANAILNRFLMRFPLHNKKWLRILFKAKTSHSSIVFKVLISGLDTVGFSILPKWCNKIIRTMENKRSRIWTSVTKVHALKLFFCVFISCFWLTYVLILLRDTRKNTCSLLLSITRLFMSSSS